MCGIFGVSLTGDSSLTLKSFRAIVNDLFCLSESRGKEAAGIALLSAGSIYIYKEAIRASAMIRRSEYKDILHRLNQRGSSSEEARRQSPVTAIGHSRLVTTGSQQNRLNNQPVVNSGVVGVHNGIIVNDEDLWTAFPTMVRCGHVDSEVIVGLIRKFLVDKESMATAIRKTFNLIKGVASIAVVFDDIDCLALATNNGSLYMCTDSQHGVLMFASERHILRSLMSKRYLYRLLGNAEITHIRPGEGYLVNPLDLAYQRFSLNEERELDFDIGACSPRRQLIDVEPRQGPPKHTVYGDVGRVRTGVVIPRIPTVLEPTQPVNLRRCTQCIMPETMPFIEFDRQGVCNYCRNYRMINVKGRAALEALLQPHQRPSGEPDCLVGLSGGRDSSYGLHFIKTVLGRKPIAYTYDWGMVTDLARRNISRLCGQLGVEHILVSADIEKKRRYIRKNVLAWLKRPHLGMIPLFMAGDKKYFYCAQKLKKQLGVPLIFLCENMLERTDFKSGFSGIPPYNSDQDHVYTLPILSKLGLVGFYGRQYLANPAYLNTSIPDTFVAYMCYYLLRRDYLNLFNYVMWDEDEITSALIENYGWETASDTQTTWRIGDGTAPFYNYIYYTIAGFTENDSFRSNQVRQGIITREKAMELAACDNQPRWDSIKWYLDVIGLGGDFEAIIKRINEIPKLYET